MWLGKIWKLWGIFKVKKVNTIDYFRVKFVNFLGKKVVLDVCHIHNLGLCSGNRGIAVLFSNNYCWNGDFPVNAPHLSYFFSIPF